MTSYARIVANRANAARSTGPRTRAGKARAARNARRHGLSVPVLADPALAPDIEALAGKLAGEGATAARRAAAVRIAEAQLDLGRIRRFRLAIAAELSAGRDVTKQLIRLDRYEQRARVRRSLALKAFDTATA